MTQRDTLHRIGIGLLSFVCLYMGFLWWTWLLGRMGPQHSGSLALKLILAAVVFIPLLLFLWLMAWLIKPRRPA
jgi:hypothetical protein